MPFMKAMHAEVVAGSLLVRTGAVGRACRHSVVVALLLSGVLTPCTRGDVVTAFDGPTLDAAIHLDVPDPGVGDITLDTVNHMLRFIGTGADLWNDRNGLPYAWTEVPHVDIGEVWRAETEVQFHDWSPYGRIVGITTYAGPDGFGGANAGQEFTFGLDHWDGPNGVWVQGLGDNRPGDSENLNNALDTDIVDLRMDVTVGNMSSNTYDFSYKLPAATTWTSLGTIHDVNDDDRVAMFFKGGPMDVSFNYFKVAAASILPEPGTVTMLGVGAISVWVIRLRRKRRTDAGAPAHPMPRPPSRAGHPAISACRPAGTRRCRPSSSRAGGRRRA